MQNYKQLLTSILITLCFGCSDNRTTNRTIQQKAIEITNRLDSSSVQVFYEWNYIPRGKAEIWYKAIQNTAWYNLIYTSFPDTLKIYVNGDIPTFLKTYPLNFVLESGNYSQISFLKSKDNNIRITATHNNTQHNIRSRIQEKDVFKQLNPIEQITNLSKLKDSLSLIGITSNKDLGNFIQFYLSPEDILTYLPEDLNLDPKFEGIWLSTFTKGKTIKKNWNLGKQPKPANEK